MRISDQDAEVPGANPNDVNSSDKSRKDEPSAFSRTLAKKRDSQPQDAPATKPGRGERAAGIVPDQQQNPLGSRFDSPLAAERVAPSAVEVPPELQQLVREISVVVNQPGNQQVHIELNSNVLKGLQIHIERQNGAVAIQFQSASPEVSRLVSTNLNSLAQGLADRGVNISDIRVNQPPSVGSAPRFRPPSNLERRGQGGRPGRRG